MNKRRDLHTNSSYIHITCLLFAEACHWLLAEQCNIVVQSTWPFQSRRGKVKMGGKAKEKKELTSVWFSRGWSSFKTGNALRERNPNWNRLGFSEREYFIENAMGCSLFRTPSCKMSNKLFQRALSSELPCSLWRDSIFCHQGILILHHHIFSWWNFPLCYWHSSVEI